MTASQRGFTRNELKNKLIDNALDPNYADCKEDFQKSVHACFNSPAKPQQLILDSENDDYLHIFLIGDGGWKGKAQKNVANLLRQHVEEYRQKFPKSNMLGINLGDSFYSETAIGNDYLLSPSDQKFNRQWKDIYTEGLPWFFIGGNHCGNLSKKENMISPAAQYTRKILYNQAALINIITRAYGRKEKYEFSEEAKIIFHSNKVTLKEISSLPMYMRFFHYAIDVNHLRLFFLDTNTLGLDFIYLEQALAALETKNMSTEEIDQQRLICIESLINDNQAAFLIHFSQKAIEEGKTCIRLEHQPTEQMYSKRAYDHDAHMYLYDYNLNKSKMDEVSHYVSLPAEDKNDYAKVLWAFYLKWKLDHQLEIAAHAHTNWIDGNHICCGAAGAHLHPLHFFGKRIPHVNDHGFMILSINTKNPKDRTLRLITENNFNLVFEGDFKAPVRQDTDPQVIQFRKDIFTVCDEYFDFLHNKQKEKKGRFFPDKIDAPQLIYNGSWWVAKKIVKNGTQYIGWDSVFNSWQKSGEKAFLDKMRKLLKDIKSELVQDKNLSHFNEDLANLKNELVNSINHLNWKQSASLKKEEESGSNISHTLGDVKITEKILAFLNNPSPSDYFTTVSTVLNITRELYNTNSNNAVYRKLMATILELIKNENSPQYFSLLSDKKDSLDKLLDYIIREIDIEDGNMAITNALHTKLSVALTVLLKCKYVPTNTSQSKTPTLSNTKTEEA